MDTSTALEASPSSSPSSSSSTTSSSSPYDVFLSFGEDTRKTFTDHLYWTMKDAGIDFFMEENESIRRGENISDKVNQIIEGSKVSVIVFSSRYADSIWCLEELVQIMECSRTLKQIVLPIFYDLCLSDVIGTFVLAFQKHRERFHDDTDIQEKLRRWTDALIAAAGLIVRVFTTTNGYEGMFIKEIIAEINVGIAFSELQRFDSPKLEDIDSTQHTDIASSVSSANPPLSLAPLKRRHHEPDRSDRTSRKSSEIWKVRVLADIHPDGYSWRKYGHKDVPGSSHPRSYYRCTYRNTQGCGAIKHVERDPDDPAMLTVTYRGVHGGTCAQWQSQDLLGGLTAATPRPHIALPLHVYAREHGKGARAKEQRKLCCRDTPKPQSVGVSECQTPQHVDTHSKCSGHDSNTINNLDTVDVVTVKQFGHIQSGLLKN